MIDGVAVMESSDYDVMRNVRIKKMIWSNAHQKFITHYFVRVLCPDFHTTNRTTQWLEQEFGPPKYQSAWWQDPMNARLIYMTDSTASFWHLKYSSTT